MKTYSIFIFLSLIFWNQITPITIAQEIGIPYPIGSPISSPMGYEYSPILTADGKTLYFCGQDRADNLGMEDMFVSQLKEGEWTKPMVIKKLSVSAKNEAPLAISADENLLIFFVNGKIYQTRRSSRGWERPVLFKALNYQEWNADVCITADGNTIFFASGTVTGLEIAINIYLIEKQKDGTWSEPIKLDSKINVGKMNRSPFLHPDMKTLYFSTNGYGNEQEDLDIYKTTRLSEDSWTAWSEPVNMGPNINTSEADWGLKLTTKGDQALYNREQHIYMVDLPKELQATRAITISGRVINSIGEPLNATITWENLKTGKELGSLKSNPQNGKYFITLPQGKNYGFYISKKEYYPMSDNVDLSNNVSKYDIKKNFVLTEVKKILEGESSIKLNNIFFDTGNSASKRESHPELNRLAEFILQNPGVHIEISGHTDNVGTDSNNMKLSQQRANSVKQYLISQKVPSQQLKSVGYGETRPSTSNDSPKGRAQNRRVEFQVVRH